MSRWGNLRVENLIPSMNCCFPSILHGFFYKCGTIAIFLPLFLNILPNLYYNYTLNNLVLSLRFSLKRVKILNSLSPLVKISVALSKRVMKLPDYLLTYQIETGILNLVSFPKQAYFAS